MKLKLLALLAVLGLLAGCAVSPQPGAETGTESLPPDSTPSLPVEGELQVYCFQAGKADAFLFWNEAGAVLLDTGESGFGKTILEKLEALGIQRLDYLIITHFDKDHVGGAKKLLISIPVGTVLQSNCPKTGSSAYDKYAAALAEQGMEAVTLRESLSFTLGDVRFTVEPPARESYQTDASNNSSLIVTVTHGSSRLLFTGDAEDERLEEYLAGDPAPCVFVKLPPHGVYQSSLTELLEKTSPSYALITSSEEEPEEQKTLDLLSQSGVECFLTRSAPVLLTSDGSSLRVEYSQ